MTLDIRGSLKNTKSSSNPYVVFEELIANGIDAFLIRKHNDLSAADLRVVVEINFTKGDLLGNQEQMEIVCTDNGCGIGEEQLEAFLTKDTSYKDDLLIPGIGACKGAGRIQFFHHFSGFAVTSTSFNGKSFVKRTLPRAVARKQLVHDDFKVTEGLAQELGTTIRLDSIKRGVRESIFANVDLNSACSASMLKKKMLVAFIVSVRRLPIAPSAGRHSKAAVHRAC